MAHHHLREQADMHSREALKQPLAMLLTHTCASQPASTLSLYVPVPSLASGCVAIYSCERQLQSCLALLHPQTFTCNLTSSPAAALPLQQTATGMLGIVVLIQFGGNPASLKRKSHSYFAGSISVSSSLAQQPAQQQPLTLWRGSQTACQLTVPTHAQPENQPSAPTPRKLCHCLKSSHSVGP